MYPRTFASFVSAKTSRMSSKTPVYVAGLLLGVRPIGDWSMSIILSKYSAPSIFLNFPGTSLDLYNSLWSPLYKISLTKVLLPDPETPVTTFKRPCGKSTSIFFKLFSFARASWIKIPFSSFSFKFSPASIVNAPLWNNS